jgi:purine nucleosidase
VQHRFLIDTDTASDDAVALIMALRAADTRVLAITTVAGNVPVTQATQNALYTVELCGTDVPVYQGSAKPLSRDLVDATWFHGKDGLGDRGYPPPQRKAERRHAVDAIIDTIQANPGTVLVTLGPLTNIALAILREPDIVTNVSRCIVMGGNPCCEGNVTPAAEYNIWVDPEAARIVLRSPLPIELVGWQLSRGDAVLNAKDIQNVLSLDTKFARFAIECNSLAMEAYRRQTNETGISLPDPVAMSVALDETICTAASEHYLDVEVASELTRGMTVVDRLGVAADERNREVWMPVLDRMKKPKICWSIDTSRWKAALYAALTR